ncbi:MAG: AAA family ATPase [Bacteroidales bacterium]|nr:AAA family ATPase [Bacteroidales bacterium]
MANIINLGNEGFASARRSEYVDKSGLIGFVNRTLCSEDKFLCVTRARRFGKSMAAKMLNAYYDQSCNSDSLFRDLKIASDPTYRDHLNKEHSWSKKQQEILAFCIEPRSLEEIAIHLKVSDKYYMKRKHINPMLGVDLFMTDPEAPNSPTQRYYSKK